MVPCSLVLFLEVNIPHTPDPPVSFPPHKYNNIVGQSPLSTAVKELRDWREGSACCSEVFSLYKQAFLIMCPESLHCICRLITLLEEIGQPVPWKKWWESPICEMCFISKSVTYGQQGVHRSNFSHNFKLTLTLEFLSRISTFLV